MKRFLIFMTAAVFLLGTVSCTSCKREKQKKETVVEQTMASDYGYMSDNHADFVWYESQIVLDEWLDKSTDAGVTSVANVFQYIEDGHPHVVILTHYKDGRCDTTCHDDFWVEDCAMSPMELVITFDDAYDILMQSNYPKPHSRNCVLREPLGPSDCNPQYVFGSMSDCYFVDAVTGEVSATDPAFKPNE